MNRPRAVPSSSGGTLRRADRSTQGTLVALVILFVLVSSAGFGQALLSSAFSAAGHLKPASSITPGGLGDLTIPSGETYVIQAPEPGGLYYQQGNITVDSGGTLIVENTTLSFVQYVTNGATVAQNFAHLYHFTDAGTVEFKDSTLTTDIGVLNFSAKLFVSVTGALTAWDSAFEFPGWIAVAGSNAVATFNDSTITANPGIVALLQMSPPPEPQLLLGDTVFAPSISVTGGAQLDLFDSSYLRTYADNTTLNGFPTPAPFSGTGLTVPTTGADFGGANFSFPDTAPFALAQNALYANAVSEVSVTIDWTNPSATGTTAVSVLYDGGSYALGDMSVAAASGSKTFTEDSSSALVQAIATFGLPFASSATFAFGATGAGSDVTLDSLTVTTTPAVNYNLTVSGVNATSHVVSSISTVDSEFDFNWIPSYFNSSNYSSAQPAYPWDSNKLWVTDGATGYLGNFMLPDTGESLLPANFSTSVLLTGGNSSVYTYRWAEFNVSGRNNILLEGATVNATYAYPSQPNNAVTTRVNNLETASPAIWGFLQYWDSLHGIPAYGQSNGTGIASLLLASTEVNDSAVPTGNFLGAYHIVIGVPAVGVPPQAYNWSVRPYPEGVAPNTPGYGEADGFPPMVFSDYFGAATLGVPVVTANGTVASANVVRIGQELGVGVTLTDAGTAKITSVSAALWYNNTTKVGTYGATGLDLTAPGQTYAFNVSWLMNDTTTGLAGMKFLHDFQLVVAWNDGLPSRAGGNVSAVANVTIAPSQIRFVSVAAPPTSLNPSDVYALTGVLQYNGSKAATITLIATPVGGGTTVTLALGTSHQGAFTIAWNSGSPLGSLLAPGTAYTLQAIVTYNGVTAYDNLTGTYSVPAVTSPVGFLFEKILGLPLWLWLVIAAAVVAGILVALFVVRRQAAGKLVECGECGELIPEDATVCPKCGAEFESDLVRCSRCSSTIPANSQYCPECSAQLLGKPGEGESDPERQAYADFTEKFRAESKKELGENYTESAFWDWWKRQPTYVPFSQWKLQQAQGAPRAGMAAPPVGTESTAPPTGPSPPRGGAPPAGGAAAAASATAPMASAAPPPAAPPSAPGSLKPCPNCGKEIPPEYLVCPFCGAVTQ